MTEHEPEAAQPPVEGPQSVAPPPVEAPTAAPIATPPTAAPAIAPPVVPWEATASPAPLQGGWPTGITIGGVLSDTFARYAADPIRIFLVGLVPAVLTMLGAASTGSTALATLVSLLSTSVTLVLVDRGPRGSLRYALGLGLRRLGWVLLTGIVAGLAVGLAAAIPAIIIIAEFGSNPGLAIVLGLLLAIPVAWVWLRLTLAIPAVVVDDVNTSDGLDRARTATRGRAVLSLFVVLFVVEIAVVPVSLGAGALTIVSGIPSGLVLILAGVMLAIVSPLGTIAQLSAYRRAFPAEPEPAPRPRPAWLESPEFEGAYGAADVAPPPDASSTPLPPVAATAAPDAPTSTNVAVPPPAFGRVARGIAGLTIAIGILGVGAFGFAIVSTVAGSIGKTVGNVAPGTIAFGPQGSLQSCSVYGQTTTLRPLTDTVFIGHFRRPATALDEVRLRVSVDGTEIINEVEKRGSYACLGNDKPERDIEAGTYHFAMYLNDELTAEGTLIVR